MTTSTHKKRNYNKKRYDNKKKGYRRQRVSDIVQLMDTGFADKSRNGSTLVHHSCGFFRTLGEKLKELTGKSNINSKNFIDIGAGHGLGLNDLSRLYGCSTVGIEYNASAYEGSLLHCKHILEKNKGKKYVPFIPIQANGCHISTFGTADIICIWGKGQSPDFFEHVYERFCKDPVVKFMISSEPYLDNVLSDSGLEQAAKVLGNLPTMCMMMYIYRKVNFKPQEFGDVDPLHTKIETAFHKMSAFKCTQKSKKRTGVKEYLRPYS